MSSKTQDWNLYIQTLAAVISSQSQAAYAALTKSLQYEWVRVNRDFSSLMNDLEHCLCTVFLPALLGVEVTALEHRVFGLPLKYGGLGIINSVRVQFILPFFYANLRILGTATFEFDEHVFSVRSTK